MSLQRGKVFSGAISSNYIMKHSASGSLILEATATELLQYSPLNIVNGAVQMESKYVLSTIVKLVSMSQMDS